MGNHVFYGVFLSFFAGIFVASFVHIGATFVFIVLIAMACLSVLPVKRGRSTLYFICLVFFCLGVYRLEISKTDFHPLDLHLGQKITLTGFVSGEPEEKDMTQRFFFKPDDSTDKIIVSTALYPRYEYGEALKIVGTMKFPENFESYPGGPEFDYVAYLSKDGVRYIINRPFISKLGENRGNSIISFLIKIKRAFMDNIERLMPEPHSSLVAGILLGEKGALPPNLREDFRRSGLTHILVLSGSNVTIVAESLMNIFSFLPRVIAHSLGAFSIVLFALMTGASATTVRASIMALIVIMSRRTGRDYNVSRALIVAGLLMLLQNPRILVFDIGFQLSFLSTLALVYISPIIMEKLSWVTEKFQIRQIVSATMSTQIFILPFMLYKRGEVSIISLITNLIVLPLVPWSMFGGFMTGFFGFFSDYIALPIAWATDIILSWMIFVVSFFG
ncbi:MAG: ComEC/Rec2 family competence protein, partial [bacterium]|nr:ComEC/Rec2 family competence protein [bacterium]